MVEHLVLNCLFPMGSNGTVEHAIPKLIPLIHVGVGAGGGVLTVLDVLEVHLPYVVVEQSVLNCRLPMGSTGNVEHAIPRLIPLIQVGIGEGGGVLMILDVLELHLPYVVVEQSVLNCLLPTGSIGKDEQAMPRLIPLMQVGVGVGGGVTTTLEELVTQLP